MWLLVLLWRRVLGQGRGLWLGNGVCRRAVEARVVGQRDGSGGPRLAIGHGRVGRGLVVVGVGIRRVEHRRRGEQCAGAGAWVG